MDAPNCFIDAGQLEEDITPSYPTTDLDKMSKAENKEDIKSNPVPVLSLGCDEDIHDRQMSTSMSSRSSCNSRKSKLRLVLEMNIKPSGSVDYDYFKESLKDQQPITVTVDYPDDLFVTVNARIQKPAEISEDIVESPAIPISPILNHTPMRQYAEQSNINQTILNSTFVKAAHTSTMIYPIPEEPEVVENTRVNAASGGHVIYKSPLKSSGNSTKSLYQTVLGGNDSMFGNISIVSKTRKENLTEADDSIGNLVNDHLSLSVNSISRIYPIESMTPSEKLANALHKLARYRGAWGIFEDEYRIITHLITLNRLLITEAGVIQTICSDDDYQELEGLISYFVKEKRFIIRSELLQTFTLLYKSSDIVDFINGSEIPVVVAREIALGNFMSKETYEYAVFFLQIITSGPLSESHYDCIGPAFYVKLIEMAYKAEQYHCKPIADVLLYIMLTYHGNLREESNQWECLNLLAYKNLTILGKFKKMVLNIVVQNVGSNHGGLPVEKICQILRFLTDVMKCNSTRSVFTDSELDVLMVSLIHCFEEVQFNQVVPDIMLTVYRILKLIKTEPSGLDRLRRTLKRMKSEADGSGDNCTGNLTSKILKLLRT